MSFSIRPISRERAKGSILARGLIQSNTMGSMAILPPVGDVSMSRKIRGLVHSDHSAEIPRIRKISGQLSGVEKMINDGRPCVEIMQQARAVHSAVKALEIAILKRHLNTCILNSARSESSQAFNQRLKDLLGLIKG
ncbi:MAG: hypothetical protein C5B49_06550 [Bdellovibrio sp.]|nr:MAG: hypothetical protein C5B49_06550 [Bdellovibrio sp.]